VEGEECFLYLFDLPGVMIGSLDESSGNKASEG